MERREWVFAVLLLSLLTGWGAAIVFAIVDASPLWLPAVVIASAMLVGIGLLESIDAAARVGLAMSGLAALGAVTELALDAAMESRTPGWTALSLGIACVVLAIVWLAVERLADRWRYWWQSRTPRERDPRPIGYSLDPHTFHNTEGWSTLNIGSGPGPGPMKTVMLDPNQLSEPEEVMLTGIAPTRVRPGEQFAIEIVMHVEEARPSKEKGRRLTAERRSTPIKPGTRLRVTVMSASPALTIAEPLDQVTWEGPKQSVTFVVACAPGTKPGNCWIRAAISTTGDAAVELARVNLQIEVVTAWRRQRATTRSPSCTVHREFFASYARADESVVIGKIAALKAIGLDVFVDCMDIREGSDWQGEILREVSRRGGFLLFWSPAAAKSPHVEKEWRHRLERRGLYSIQPAALEPPERCPPPAELAELEFGSVHLHVARSLAQKS
jgi:hypothetical protein